MIKPYLEALVRQIKKDNCLTDVYFNIIDYKTNRDKDPFAYNLVFNNKMHITKVLKFSYSANDSAYDVILQNVLGVRCDKQILIFSILDIKK
jgi:hypothetical protein